jgi:hypothetical protein
VETGEGRPHPPHKTIHHALFTRLVEADGELVPVDGYDVAIAEFEVEEGRYSANARDTISSNEYGHVSANVASSNPVSFAASRRALR